MSDLRFYAGQSTISRVASDTRLVGARSTRDGALFTAPWELALVMEGKVFGTQAGTVTTGIAGHATIDADQPEFAIRAAADTLVIIPLRLLALAQSFETTLGIHELMWAASNIDVANGTSTATAVAMNYNMSSSNAATAVTRHTYSANGTDPLTADNHIELVRNAGVFDSDAATSGITGLQALWCARDNIAPVLARTGSIVGYGGGGTTANFFFQAAWAEFTQAEIE